MTLGMVGANAVVHAVSPRRTAITRIGLTRSLAQRLITLAHPMPPVRFPP